MTTPNGGLIARLRGQAYTTSRPDQLCEQAADALQSQAERIKELEAQKPVSYFCKWRDAMYGIAKLANERDILRAQLAAIAAAEPAYYLGGGRLYADKTRALFDNSKNAITELFTRPMPAQLAEVEKTEPVAYMVQFSPGSRWVELTKEEFDSDLDGHIVYKKQAFFTHPMPAQDVTELVEALEKLARLGNGEHYGNSDGNMIARDALYKYKGAK